MSRPLSLALTRVAHGVGALSVPSDAPLAPVALRLWRAQVGWFLRERSEASATTGHLVLPRVAG